MPTEQNNVCPGHDKTVHLIVATALAAIALGAPIGITILTVTGHSTPESLNSVASMSIGAMVMYLTQKKQ